MLRIRRRSRYRSVPSPDYSTIRRFPPDKHVNVHVHSASKTSTVTEEAYERLRAHKRDDESVTDTLLRLTADSDPTTGFGGMTDIEGFREAVEGSRERVDDDLRDRTDRRAE